jgi:hypothetical protein
MTLMEEIKTSIKLEIRADSKDYLEAVVTRQGFELLQSILTKHLGPAAKGPGQKATFPPSIQGFVDSMGGVRLDQSFYYKQEKNHILFAALWPWGSNPENMTLKCGVSDL